MLTSKFCSNLNHLRKCALVIESSYHFHVPIKSHKCSITKLQSIDTLASIRHINTSSLLNKYNKHSSKDEDSDSDNDANDPELKDERDSKVVKVKVNSLRADLLLKAGLSIARNKIEVIFYESKIRVNGQKIAKKSAQLSVGDEIDVIKGFSNVNPSHLVISRVIIVSAKEKDEAIGVHLRRYRTMLVENYTGINAYKSSESSVS